MRKLVKAIHRLYRGGEKGFTLIELLVVIGILAALAGVVTLGVTQFIGRGQTEACETDMHNVQTGVAAWKVDNPAGDCTTLSPCNDTGCTGLVPSYLLSDPLGSYTIDTNCNVTKVSSTACP